MEEKVKTFLDEGYDFIEESCSAEPLVFSEADKDIIVESSDGSKSNFRILGVCRGVFQPINEPSRNSRIYESNHWEIQLNKPEVQERLKTRSMWGTLGHFDRRITDNDIREGLVSHIISKLEIREDVNKRPYLYGELEILDTPSGRILEGMYKGGANLFVSSRGAGKLLTVMGDTLKHVDPNSFWFEGFDIVKNPGFLKARPVYESAVSGDKKEEVSSETQEPRIHESEEQVPFKSSNESQELQTLKSQIDKLAKIVEKVVDDVYEEIQEQPVVEPEKPEELSEPKEMKGEKPVKTEKVPVKEALVDFVSLMANSNISEEAFEEIIDIIAKAEKGN